VVFRTYSSTPSKAFTSSEIILSTKTSTRYRNLTSRAPERSSPSVTREYQLSAVRAIYLNIAGQAANVWDSRNEVSVANLRNGVGIGLNTDTIIGPVRLDFGMGEQQRYMVYFAAGFDF
jgi:outer membrane translocation and assembly module TamA